MASDKKADPLSGGTGRALTALAVPGLDILSSWATWMSALDALNDMVLLTEWVDGQARAVYANPAFLRRSGYTLAEFLGQSPTLLHGPQTDADTVQRMATAMARGEPIEVRIAYHNRSGEPYWNWLEVVPLRNAQGQVTHHLSLQLDITHQIEVDTALRDSETRFRSLIELSSDWYWELDADLRYSRFEGLKDESFPHNGSLGKHPWGLPSHNLSPADWDQHRALLLSHQPFRGFEVERESPQGERIWISVAGEPVFDEQGRFGGYRGVGRYITARKQAEARLQEAQHAAQRQLAFIERLTARVPGLVYMLRRSAQGWYSMPFASQGLRDHFGIDPQAVKGDARPFFSLLDPDAFKEYQRSIEVSAQDLSAWNVEYRVRFPDGREVVHATSAVPYRESDGAVVWYGSSTDVTERVKAVEALQSADRALSERTQLLNVTLDNLAQGVVQFDQSGRAVYFNQQYLDILGLPRDLLERQPTLDEIVDFQFARGDFGSQIGRDDVSFYGRVHGGALQFPERYLRLTPDGRTLEIKTRALPTGGWVRTFSDVTEFVRAQEALRRQEERLQLVLLGSNDGAWDWNLLTGEAYFAPRWWQILGLDPDAQPARASLWTRYTDPLDLLRVTAEIESVLREGRRSFELEFRMRHHSGRTVYVLDRGFVVHNGEGRPIRLSGTLTDITARKALEKRLEESESRLRTLFDAFPGRVWFKDPQGRFAWCNSEVAQAYGHTPDAMLGLTSTDIWPSGCASPLELDRALDFDRQALETQQTITYESDLPLGPGQGVARFEVIKRAVFDSAGEPLGVLGIARDITERKRAEAQIERLAFYDPLTNLCNRRLFQDRLHQAQAASVRSGHWAAVCFIDLDNFKDLNDTLGHDTGDQLLLHVAQRLQQVVREEDTVGRIGGDEFVVLIENLSDGEDEGALYANAVGQKILQALNTPYQLGPHQHHNTPSIGITLFREAQERVEDILKRADLAMYQSKSAGRNTVRFFDPHMQAVVLARSELERDLRHAVRENELRLFYQPVVNAQRQVMGYEALLRWQHPVRGMVSPGEFIPVAEQSGLILPMGQWVLQTACERLVLWAQQPETADWTLAVNLSARQLRQPDFVDLVTDLLRRTGARADRLKLELTESLLLHDVEDTIVKMERLAALGIRFALDDFGTGYSSLSYLKRLPLSQLKIDQSFVRDLLTDPNDAAIARTILQLADSLEMDVVAEGVETDGQLARLIEMGCTAFQGYLFGRPQAI